MVKRIDRRSVLAVAAAAGVASAAACTRSSTEDSASSDGGNGSAVQWWDHFDPLEDALEKTFSTFTDASGVSVERTVYNPNDMGQALQLAQSSDQLPDVFTNLFGTPSAALVDRGTVQSVRLDDQAQEALKGVLFEGVHTFDGEVFSVPIFSHQQHSSLTWVTADLVDKAGHDPDQVAGSWDEFRTLCGDLVNAGVDHPWVAPLGYTDRLQEHVIDLAQSAGLAAAVVGISGSGVTDAATGDYPFASPPFLDAFEFLRSLVTDGYMLPASTSLDAREARVRWASGEAAIFFDGAWNAGVLAGQFEEFVDGVRVGNVPSPDGNGTTARAPSDGQFWCSGTSERTEDIGALFSLLAQPEFAVALAENMDQPPTDLAAVQEADVPQLYSSAVDIFADKARMAPSPVVRNAAVAQVIAGMNDVHPDLGEITQGYLGGDIDDLEGQLKSYCDKLSKEREESMAKVVEDGGEVTLQDWIFEEYEAGDDYDVADY